MSTVTTAAPSGRRGRLVVAAGLVIGVLVTLWATGARQERQGRLDPDNPHAEGAQAVARVLADHGVAVDIVRDRAAFDAASLDDATVLVTASSDLGRGTAQDLRRRTTTTDLVVVEPSSAVSALLGAGVQPTEARPAGPLDAACEDPRLSGLRLDVDRSQTYPEVAGDCFPLRRGGSVGGAAYAPQQGSLAFLGAGDVLTNGAVTRGDNAAIALRLLGGGSRLVWYVPDLADLAAGDQVGLWSLLPRWLAPGLWLSGLVLLATIVWRGRRLGALVVEPLPVTVRALETTLSRGRLYRRSGDRGHAATALRSAARARAAERLRLPRRTPLPALVGEVSRATGRPAEEVARLLGDEVPPASDTALTRLARDLAELDDRLRPSADTPVPPPPSAPTRSSP